MKPEIDPSEVSPLVPFSSSLSSSFDLNEKRPKFGNISKDGFWMWIAEGAVLNVYSTETSKWCGGYCFDESLKNPLAEIACVVEFNSSRVPFLCLLVAVNSDQDTLICMFDVNTSKVVRSILVPDLVLCMEVVSSDFGACRETQNFYIQLRYMFGIVSLGTASGNVFFLDLCLDEDFICDENLPNITTVLRRHELYPEERERIISKEQHPVILVNDKSYDDLSDCGIRDFGHLPYGQIHVTALKFIRNTLCLATGFYYGGIQIYGVQDLCLHYNIDNQPKELPVISFAFQEPENDPRNFCYLWVIKGYTAEERPDQLSVACMYSLTYASRGMMADNTSLYMDLQSCYKRFELPLTNDPVSSMQLASCSASCFLSCQIVSQMDCSHLDVASPNESDAVSENMSLCFVSWVVWSPNDTNPTSYHLALFDLNQWYQAQMPSSLSRSCSTAINPYIAHYNLEELLQNFGTDPVLGLHVPAHSIRKFKYILPSEEFFYPSALDFQIEMFSEKGVCKASFLGLQKSLLYKMADLGSDIIVNPKEFYSYSVVCGLVANSIARDPPVTIQREALLQLALDHHVPVFFMKCLKDWKYSDSVNEGITSKLFLVNWAWRRLTAIKSSIDKIGIPLFNCCSIDIDRASIKHLHSYRTQLELIDSIFAGYEKYVAPRTEMGIQDLQCRRDVVSCISMYLQVMLWLRSVHILPEANEGEETNNLVFPYNTLVAFYSSRRKELQKIHSSIGVTDILLIDGLMRESFSSNTWQEKGGNSLYPPPSVYAALSCYLCEGVPLEKKHSLMYYLLLDICHAPCNADKSFVASVMKFPEVFGLSVSSFSTTSKLVEAFWHLDKKDFENAIKKLFHPSVKSSLILQWQHQRIIKSFLYQRQSHKALKYLNHMNPPENALDDMKLHMSVLLSRGAIIRAFEYQRQKQAEGFGKELLNHLFMGCQETHRLKDLMYLPLNLLESNFLVKFLSENEDLHAKEALVMYNLLHCNFYEAAEANQRLSLNSNIKSLSARERAVSRDALVESLLLAVPKMEKNLAEEVSRMPVFSIVKGDVCKPLSLTMKSSNLKTISYSDVLSNLLSKASSIMTTPYVAPQSPLRSKSKTNFNEIPFLRPPMTPEYKRPALEAVGNTTPLVKRTLVSPVSEFSSPTKKSRLLDNAPFKVSPLLKKKVPKHLVADVASLLQSPPIHRASSTPRSEVLRKSSQKTQSILKKSIEPIKISSADFFRAETPTELPEEISEEEDENVMEIDQELAEETRERQIRFSVPSKEDLNASTISFVESKLPLVENSSTSRTSDQSKLQPEDNSPEVLDHLSVSRRSIMMGLARDPVKSHFRLSWKSSESFPASNPETAEVENDSNDEDACSSSSRDVDPCVSANTSFQSVSSTAAMSSAPSTPIAERTTVMEQSISSSSSSCYSSASERSLIVTPRKPIRTSSRNPSPIPSSALNDEKKSSTVAVEEKDISPGKVSFEIQTHSSNAEHNQENVVESASGVKALCKDIAESVSEYALCPESIVSARNPIHGITRTHISETVLQCDYLSTEKEDAKSSSDTVETNLIKENEDVSEVFIDDDDNRSAEPNVQNQNIITAVDSTASASETIVLKDAEGGNIIMEPVFPDEQEVYEVSSTTDDDVEICSRQLSVDIIEDSQDKKCADEPSEKVSEDKMDVDIIEIDNEPKTSVKNLDEVSSDSKTYSVLYDIDEKINVTVPVVNIEQTGEGTFVVEAGASSSKPEDVLFEEDKEVSLKNIKQSERANFEVEAGSSSSKPESVVEAGSSKPESVPYDVSEKVDVPAESIKQSGKDDLVIEASSSTSKPEDALNNTSDKAGATAEQTTEDLTVIDEVCKSSSKRSSYIPIKERIQRAVSTALDEEPSKEEMVSPSVFLPKELSSAKDVIIEGAASSSEPFKTPEAGSRKETDQSRETATLPQLSSRISKHFDFMSTDQSRRNTMSSELSSRASQRFDFMSSNYSLFESNLKRKTIFALQETCESPNYDKWYGDNKERKTKSYVFKSKISESGEKAKSSASKESTEKSAPALGEASNSKIDSSERVSFLDSLNPESYEQFTDNIKKAHSEDADKAMKSSPNNNPSLSIIQKEDTKPAVKSSVERGSRKKSSSKLLSSGKVQKSAKKKSSKRGEKLEFSFAEPHAPTDPEILEALSSPPEVPVASFMFSPPLTRGRLRHKTLESTLGSSFASAASETSFSRSKMPPVDPILEEITAKKEIETMTPTKRKSKTIVKKTTPARKTRSSTSMDQSSASVKPDKDEPDVTQEQKASPTKHSMVLRQTKIKPKSGPTF